MKNGLNEFKLNTFQLRRRAGEMKEYELDITVLERIGVDLVSIPVGGVIEVDARLESVAEGILLTAAIFAKATGECIRCLDPIEFEVDRKIQELYYYEAPLTDAKNSTGNGELEEDDELIMEGDLMDLEIPIRDAIILSLPVNPVCNLDCQGLCPECGLKWLELEPDHTHKVVDLRWASLEGLKLNDPDFKI